MVASNRYSRRANLAVREHQPFFVSLSGQGPEFRLSSRVPSSECRPLASFMSNYCVLGSSRWTVLGTGSGFDGPSSPRNVPSASSRPQVPLFFSQQTPNPKSRTPALSEPRELYEYQKVDVKTNILRAATQRMLESQSHPYGRPSPSLIERVGGYENLRGEAGDPPASEHHSTIKSSTRVAFLYRAGFSPTAKAWK